jgi:hypothetical protein
MTVIVVLFVVGFVMLYRLPDAEDVQIERKSV